MSGTREIQDHYFREAKRQGYVARSAFKLEEIQERRAVIPRGGFVLDLGCAPGAWLQAACRAIGPRSAGGRVVGLDLKEMRVPGMFCDDRVTALTGDVYEVSAEALLAAIDDGGAGRRYDAVVSDMMASTSGHQMTDHYASVRLARRALEIAAVVLKSGGNFVAKVFEGAEYPAFLEECKAIFGEVKGFKPKASRQISTEMYVVCKRFTGVKR